MSSPQDSTACRTKRGAWSRRSMPKATATGAVPAHHHAGPKPGDAVDQVGAQQGRRQMPAALDQHAGQAALAERPQRLAKRRDIRPPDRAGRSAPRHRNRSAPGGAARRRLRRRSPRSATCLAWRTRWLVNGRRRRPSTTTRSGARSSRPGRRQVSCGSSSDAVPMPTITASWVARSRCPRARACGPVIQRLSPRMRRDAAVEARSRPSA